MTGYMPMSFDAEGFRRWLHGMDRRIMDLERRGDWNFDQELEPADADEPGGPTDPFVKLLDEYPASTPPSTGFVFATNTVQFYWNGKGSIVVAGNMAGTDAVFVDDVLELTVTHEDGSTGTFSKNWNPTCGTADPAEVVDVTAAFERGLNSVDVECRDFCGTSGLMSCPDLYLVHDGGMVLDDLADVDVSSSPPADDQVLSYDSGSGLWVPRTVGGGGGASAAWSQYANYDGSSFASFTGGSGSWSSDGTVIRQTDNTAADRFAYPTANPGVPLLGSVVECELRLPSASQSGGDLYAGLIAAMHTSYTSDRPMARIKRSGSSWSVDLLAETLINIAISAKALDQWITFRLAFADAAMSVWVDGTLVGTVLTRPGIQHVSRFGLFARNHAHFRNIKAWSMDPTSLPA